MMVKPGKYLDKSNGVIPNRVNPWGKMNEDNKLK